MLVPKIALKHVVSRIESMLPFTFFCFVLFLLFCLLFLTSLQHSCYFLPELDREVLQGGLGKRKQRSPRFRTGGACPSAVERYLSEHSIVYSSIWHFMPTADLLKQSFQKPLSLAILSTCSFFSTDYKYKCLFLLRATASS